jgi:predicted enzyme related to lactoylglutathione lyase
VNEPGTLCWNELTTRDPDGSEQFYGAIFGWQAAATDFDGVEYTLRSSDGTVSVSPFDTPVGRAAMLSDPLGAALSVIALAAPSA